MLNGVHVKRGAKLVCLSLLLFVAGRHVEAGGTTDPFFVPSPGFYLSRGITPSQDDKSAKSSPNLIHQIPLDFKNVFTTKQNLVILGVGLGATWAASVFDDEIANSRFNSTLYDEGGADDVLEPGTILGSAAVQVGGAFATYGLGKLLSKPRVEALGRDLVRAQIVAQTLTQVLKLATQRKRPDGTNQRSFPSGHASGSFASATVIQRHFGWKAGIPAYVVASFIGASRVNQNKHYLSDVVFGATLGIIAGRTVTLYLGKHRFAVTPMVVAGGGGVRFVWLGSS